MNRKQRRLAEKQNRAQFSPAVQNLQAIADEATSFLNAGKLPEAEQLYRKLLALKVHNAEVYNNLGNTLERSGKPAEAIPFFQLACELQPNETICFKNLGLAHMLCGNADQAFNAFKQAVRLNPEDGTAWNSMSQSLARLTFARIDQDMLHDLLIIFQHPAVDTRIISHAILSAVRCQPAFTETFSAIIDTEAREKPNLQDCANRLSTITLLLKHMEICQFLDIDIENMMTTLRRDLVIATSKGITNFEGLPFYAALALQCFVNSYVYAQAPEETEAVDWLQEKIAAVLQADKPVPPSWIAALGAYRPLHQLPYARQLGQLPWPLEMHELIRRQILEPLEEEAIRQSIPSLTGSQNAISQAVRNQYEENPYPRWTKCRLAPKQDTVKNTLQNLFPYMKLDDYESPQAPEILVAGCGTGQHALSVASRFTNANVLAIDLSLSSLAYATRKTRELGFKNIEYAQADILELGSLNRRFDIIESCGVLHHLENPMAGWRVLVDRLNEGGLMHIALYSERARQSVVKAREMIAKEGYKSTPDDIRRCRQDLIERNAKTDIYKDVVKISDFYDLSECRDLIFHVQEHRFTLPQIQSAMDELDLEFLGLELSPTHQNLFRQTYEKPQLMSDLSYWHNLEEKYPQAFIGMYQFWCRKKTKR